jgi:hypothetical protein
MKKAVLIIVVLAIVAVAAWRLWPGGKVSPERIAEFTDPTVASQLGDELGQMRLECVRALDSRDWQAAVQACDRLIKKDPHNALTHYVKAASLLQLNKPDDGAKEVEAGNSCLRAYVYNRRCCLDSLETGRVPEIEHLPGPVKQLVTQGYGLEPERALAMADGWLQAARIVSKAEPRCFSTFWFGLGLQRLVLQGKAAKLTELGRSDEANQARTLEGKLAGVAAELKAFGATVDASLRNPATGPALNSEVQTYGLAKSLEQPKISELIAELDRIWQDRG